MPDCLFPNGSTVSFDNGFNAKVNRISGFARSVAVADATPVNQPADSYKLKKFSGRMDHEPFELEFYFDTDVTNLFQGLGVDNIMTVTYPNGSTLVGNGAFIADNGGPIASDEIVMGTKTFQFTGGDGAGAPTFTPG